MTEFIEVKTAELSGAALEYSVAMALGSHGQETGSSTLRDSKHWIIPGFAPMRWDDWTPSADWSQGGPLIERFGVTLTDPAGGSEWDASTSGDMEFYSGETPLIAICRAIAVAKLGETVWVPVELMK